MPKEAKCGDLTDFQAALLGERVGDTCKPGIWKNVDFGKDGSGKPVGGQGNPLSYNIMPLPQVKNPDGSENPSGFILKNFRYYEFLNFSDGIANMGVAPNRGGEVSQNARALFYEQQVRFAEGPEGPTGTLTSPDNKKSGQGDIVHLENGAWLWLPRYVQQPGPYAPEINKERVQDDLDQPADVLIAKQISVPHGNSILALGTFDTLSKLDAKGNAASRGTQIPGSPVIPDAPCPYPTPRIPIPHVPAPPSLASNVFAHDRYSDVLTSSPSDPNDFENPNPNFALNPNLPLQIAVGIIKPDAYMHWRVTTEPLPHGKGIVTNIPFERRVSEVTDYFADYWLLFKTENNKRYLSYTQTILMRMKLENKKYGDEEKDEYLFPHITCNTLTFMP